MTRLRLALALIVGALLLASFTETPTPAATPGVAPTDTPPGVGESSHTPQPSATPPGGTPTDSLGTPTPTATAGGVVLATPASGSPATMKLDMYAIFPRGEGRDLVLDNCSSSCHNWVPLIQQKTKEDWATLCRDHIIRHGIVLSAADAGALCIYLQTHFNPETPLPKLPDWYSSGTTHPWGTFVGY